MKKIVGMTVALLMVMWGAMVQAEDCPGTSWRPGGTCRDAGLDSQRGTCLPGDRYETLCDDMPKMMKTCQGPRRCDDDERDRHRGRHDRDDRRERRDEPCDWDYVYNRPCPRGYINLDCRGACEREGGWR